MFFVIPEPPHDNPVCMSSCACYPVHVILNGPSFVGPVKDLAPPTKTLRSSKPSLKGDKPASLSSWNTRRLCVAILSSCACYPCACHPERPKLCWASEGSRPANQDPSVNALPPG